MNRLFSATAGCHAWLTAVRAAPVADVPVQIPDLRESLLPLGVPRH